jgi:hypothetical protein
MMEIGKVAFMDPSYAIDLQKGWKSPYKLVMRTFGYHLKKT